jgi:membrane protein required for colicin V production
LLLLRRVSRNLVTLLGWLLALLIAIRYFQEAALELHWVVTEGLIQESAAFTTVFLGVLGLFVLVRWLFDSWVAKVNLTMADWLFGLLIGLGRGAAMVVLATGASFYFTLPTSQHSARSLLLPHGVEGMKWMADLLPKRSVLATYLLFPFGGLEPLKVSVRKSGIRTLDFHYR